MKRREFVIAAALLAAGCAAPRAAGGDAFRSDRISVATQGNGPDVVLVHGLRSSRDVWRELAAAVPGYRYHLVQLNGFAGTAAPGAASDGFLNASAAEIARYIRQAGLKRPALIGHSMGGTLGMMIAARHPDLVSRLMVVDMMPFMGAMFGPPGATPEAVKPTADRMRDAMLASDAAALRAMVEGAIAGMVKAEGRRAEAVRHGLASDNAQSAQAFHELVVTDLRPELRNIKVPVTVLYVRSPGVPLTNEQMDAVYRASFANLPQAKLTRIPDAYHFIMWDAPERFAAEVRAFLGG
jgi:pimeloyl-ACP methyl ester carboxylesterase